eukprot:g73922.t1
MSPCSQKVSIPHGSPYPTNFGPWKSLSTQFPVYLRHQSNKATLCKQKLQILPRSYVNPCKRLSSSKKESEGICTLISASNQFFDTEDEMVIDVTNLGEMTEFSNISTSPIFRDSNTI